MLHNKYSNKGFSMIELIVTIAVMGIVTLASVGIYSWTGNSAFKEACSNITDSMSSARTETLSKSGSRPVKIYLNSDGKCVTDILPNGSSPGDVLTNKNHHDKRTNSKKMTVKAIKDDVSGSSVKLGNGDYIYLEYNSNGAFKQAFINKGGVNTNIKGIEIEYSRFGRNFSKKIILALTTGKFFTE